MNLFSKYSIRVINELYKMGKFSDALNGYLQLSLANPRLSFSFRTNIELCAKKLEANGELAYHAEHPRYFRMGHGHSPKLGALYFNSSVQSRHVTLVSSDELRNQTIPKKLKIVFVADSNRKSNAKRKVWGAETSAEYVIKHGKSLGHNIIEVDQYNFDKEAMLAADLLVLRSIDRLSDDQLAFLKSALFEKLKSYVTYQHDYSFCKFRNSIKCNGRVNPQTCSGCMASNDKYYAGQIAFYANLLQRSALNIFISHPQRHIFGEMLGSSIDPSIVILPPVDPDVFRPLNLTRDSMLIVNTSGKLNSPNKGFNNIKEYIDSNPEYRYELYTEKNQELVKFAADRKNVILMEPVDNSKLAEVYSKAFSLLVMPSVMEPAGRTPIEASLCGCKVISNRNLGVNYFNLPLHNPEKLKDLIYRSLDTLWSKLVSIVV